MKSEYFVPVLTLLLGFVPLVILSNMLGALWIDSKYAFPLVAIPSVLIGDSIFLPIFNYKFYILLKKKIKDSTFLTNWISLLIIVTLSISVSYLVIYYANTLWISDNYLGFMDITLGALSIAGIYHFWYGVVQLAIIIMFIYLATMIYKNGDIKGFDYAYSTWKVIVVFSSLTILDFLVRQILIYRNSDLIGAFVREFTSFTTLIFSIALLLGGKFLKGKMRS